MLYQRSPNLSMGFPEQGNLSALPDFRDRLINQESAYRNQHMARMTRNYWYILHRQWIRRDYAVYFDSARGFVYRDITRRQNAGMPMPVTNYCSPAVEVELAAQTKRQWIPQVVPTSDSPDIEAAAREAKDWLNASLDAENWSILRDRFTWQTIAAGTGILWQYLDENYNELSVIAPGTEVKCVSCGKAYHTQTLPVEMLLKAKEGGMPLYEAAFEDDLSEDTRNPVKFMKGCALCGGELERFDLDPANKADTDPFGLQLGLQVPKAIPRIELVSPDEFFPENQGIGVTPENIRRFGIRKVRSLSLWAAEHWPDRLDDISSVSPNTLMQYHPLLGEWNMLGEYNYAFDRGIYDEHYFEDTLVELPCAYSPKGRLTVLAGNEVLYDGDLMKEARDNAGNTMLIPRSMCFGARYKERPGEFWGESIIDIMVSPQNRLNAGDSIDHDSMVRLGAPNILLPDDMDLTGPEWNPGYGSAKLMRYGESSRDPQAVPVLFGGQYFHDQWAANRKQLVDDMKALVGPQDVEIGEAPRNISTTSGLQVLGEQAERRRAARERAIVRACERLFEHRLQLIWAFAFDDDTYAYWVKNDAGSWAQKQMNRLRIKGQTHVKIEKQAYIDRSLFQREAAREAQADQLVTPDSPMARKRLLELRGLPTDVNEGPNRQVEHARRQWTDYINEGKIPTIDPTMDDPGIHFEVLGTMRYRDECILLEEQVNWAGVLDAIAGWEDRLNEQELAEELVRGVYGYQATPQQAEEQYARLKLDYMAQEAQYQQGKVEMQKAATAGVPAPQIAPPTEPPKPIFLPAALEKRILNVWMQMISLAAEGALTPKYDEAELDAPAKAMAKQQSYMQYQSIVQAYRLYAKKAAEAALAPPPAPPGSSGGDGSPDQPVGTQPSPGGPNQPPTPPAPPGQPIRMTA